FFFQAEDGIRDFHVTGVQTCALPIFRAINYEEFKRSSVADIIYTLQRHGQQYYIVVDRDQHHIRGVVSSTEISRRLHAPVYVERQPSVADILSLARG